MTADALWSLRAIPIPDQAEPSARRIGFREHAIDMGAPEHDEPLVDLNTLGFAGRNHYAHAQNPPYYEAIPGSVDALYARKSVGARLIDVNARLALANLEVYVFDAWRPTAVQREMHGNWFPNHLRRTRPELDGAALQAEVERYWSPPSEGAASPAPHATGGAVDLTLRFKDGDALFMGGIFDDVTANADRDHFERELDGSFSAADAQGNRRLLHWVMEDAGFVGHPHEWWHFSWGDQMWARLTERDAAVYAAAEPPAL